MRKSPASFGTRVEERLELKWFALGNLLPNILGIVFVIATVLSHP